MAFEIAANRWTEQSLQTSDQNHAKHAAMLDHMFSSNKRRRCPSAASCGGTSNASAALTSFFIPQKEIIWRPRTAYIEFIIVFWTVWSVVPVNWQQVVESSFIISQLNIATAE